MGSAVDGGATPSAEDETYSDLELARWALARLRTAANERAGPEAALEREAAAALERLIMPSVKAARIRRRFMDETAWTIEVRFSDGSVWRVPVSVVARDRARHYADEFGGDVERSLAEDTLPLFRSDDYAIVDWATGNMNWPDLAPHATQVEGPQAPDYAAEWPNADKAVRGTAGDDAPRDAPPGSP